MKQQIERYYFDYNIYNKILKEDLRVNNEFLQCNNIFLSVAHIEEYYKAYKNDVGNLNSNSLAKMKNIMIDISQKRIILNPAKNSRIHAKNETFDECLDIIESDGKEINKLEKYIIENLREEDEKAKYNSTLDYEHIWERPEVVKGISEFSEFYNEYNSLCFKRLIPVYGISGAKKAIFTLPKDFVEI